MQLSPKKIKQFQNLILQWYDEHKRTLPWRDVLSRNHSVQDKGVPNGIAPYGTSLQERAYMTLISEVMSQQTQINRVVPKFEAWMQKFPTVQNLAKAKVSDVLLYWSGLGYNRRALNLKKAAEIIVKEYDGLFPQDEKRLLNLPGIGKYTARAIMCFAFDKQVAVVDTNIRKVIVTQFGLDGNEKELMFIAMKLLPKGRAYDWNQALMDYAAIELKKPARNRLSEAMAGGEKIAIPKQSKFYGSQRYYRGQVLKYVLKHKKVSLAHLGIAIKEDFTTSENEWLQKLVQELTSEGFIVQEQGMVVLAS